jgi:hypothetical protein
MIEYRFRVPSAAVFTLYSYSKALEYPFRVPTAGSLKISYTEDRVIAQLIRFPGVGATARGFDPWPGRTCVPHRGFFLE